MDDAIYASERCDLVDEWADKWLALIGLINSVSGAEEPLVSPPPPVEIDEITYQGLRFWFLDHEEQFVPLWKEFCKSRDWRSAGKEVDRDFPRKYLDNPFLFFYEPEDLYCLAQQLDLQSGIDIWEPSEYRTGMIRPIFIRLGELLLEFLDWVDRREHSTECHDCANFRSSGE
jgi:hypothetical protein